MHIHARGRRPTPGALARTRAREQDKVVWFIALFLGRAAARVWLVPGSWLLDRKLPSSTRGICCCLAEVERRGRACRLASRAWKGVPPRETSGASVLADRLHCVPYYQKSYRGRGPVRLQCRRRRGGLRRPLGEQSATAACGPLRSTEVRSWMDLGSWPPAIHGTAVVAVGTRTHGGT